MDAETPSYRLSGAASQQLDWKRLADPIRIALTQLGGDRGRATADDADAAIGVEQRAVLERAFAMARAEFRRVLEHQRNAMKFVTILLLVTLALAVASTTLLRMTPWGSTVSIASLVGLVGLLYKAWQLTRDQAMLELIPARYELAMGIATSKRQVEQVLNAFLKETSSLQSRR
jgi:hypothetical protein